MSDSPKSIYLAGPMRGYENLNWPAFDAATMDLRARGIEVFSPVEHDRENSLDVNYEFDLRSAFKWDCMTVCDVDAVVVLPGWDKSNGAKAEVAVAKAIGSPVLEYPTLVALDV